MKNKGKNKDIEIAGASEGNSPSEDVDQREITKGKPSEEIDNWLASIMGRQDHRDNVEAPGMAKKQVVSRRPEMDKHREHMEPVVVSLGPCHHGKEKLSEMEMKKKLVAKRFVEKDKPKIRNYYDEVEKVIVDARKFYAEDVVKDVSHQDFTRMMFLDGCFVAYFIEGTNQGKMELEVGRRQFPLIVRDIFLFENQLPFGVLRKLLKLRFSNEPKYQIFKFITRQTTLINFHHSNRLPRWLLGFQPVQWYARLFYGLLDVEDDDEPLNLLDFLRRMLLGRSTSLCSRGNDDGEDRIRNYTTPHQFGSVTELKEFGIRFCISDSSYISSVKFQWNLFFPRLLLPPMFINDATISQMLNLIAMELGFESSSETGVTSFLCFMDSLINHAADVKELRANGILNHALGSDEDVAKIFNELPLATAGDLPEFRNVKRRILTHRDSSVRVSTAGCLHTHFRNAWTALALAAAIVLLFLTAVQTIFTVFPRK